MNLRLFLLLALVAVAGRAADFPGTLVLGRPTNKSIAANLLSSTALSAYLEYGAQAGAYSAQLDPVTLVAGTPQAVTLTGLAANTRYYYRIRFRAPGAPAYDASPEYSFMTQRPPGSTFVFGVQGDSHPERANTQFNAAFYTRTMNTVAGDNPDFYLTSGDDFSVDTINQANPRAVTQPQVVERYNIQRPYLGIIGRSAPVFLVNGNHEQAARYLLDGTPNNVAVWAQNARNLYYAQPAPDDFYSGNSETIEHIGLLRNYYAWEWGDALFVTIDPYWGSPVVVDNDFYGGPKTANQWDITHGRAQYDWLKTTLERSRAKYKFVFAHHVMGTGRGGIDGALRYEWGGQNNNGTPGFAQNRAGWALPIHQLFVANKVTIFFQGHDHIWVRQQVDGVTYQALGSPANPNYSLFNSDAYATGERFPDSGYTRVTVAPTGVKVEYVRTYLPADERPGTERVNGTVAFSYTVGTAAEQSNVPVISTQPRSQAVSAGTAATFSVGATSALPLTYQWQRNGVAIPGATTAVLGIARAQAADAGSYTVVVSTSAGSVTSAVAALTIGSSRLGNMSVRSTAGSGSETLIVGCVVGQGDPAPLLLRGIGPALTAFGVAGALADPVLTVVDANNSTVATNDNWSAGTNSNQTVALTTRVGAFALGANALDAALVANLNPGSYSALITGKTAAPGVALMEAYDASTTNTSARLLNLSARTRVGTGAEILIVGFAVQGDAPKQVLIRASGPSLAQFGVTGVLSDPQLALFRQGANTVIQQNDNWLASTNAAQIGLVSSQVGAFALPPNSRDAVLLVTLDPGTYSAQVSGVGNTTGVALVEIYDVP
ncbi:MAG: metallophosphoesterase [Opitutaceae bacterium]|nr:metallophosphoesterase [Opitutaceae bacterium]